MVMKRLAGYLERTYSLLVLPAACLLCCCPVLNNFKLLRNLSKLLLQSAWLLPVLGLCGINTPGNGELLLGPKPGYKG